MRTSLISLLALLLSLPVGARATAVPFADIETGVAVATTNDVQVPRGTGTPFSLASGDFDSVATPYIRLAAGMKVGRHAIFAVWQPLRIDANGTPTAVIDFAGTTFRASGPVKATSQLDTYRLTYRFAVLEREGLELWLGATALLRDARIALDQQGLTASHSKASLLPLASFRFAWRFAGPVAAYLDGDAMGTSGWREEDVTAGLALEGSELDFRLGYRILEGGWDEAAAHLSSLVHQVGAGVVYRF